MSNPFVPMPISNKKENLPQTFRMQFALHKPWADILFETQLPPEVLDRMIKISDRKMSLKHNQVLPMCFLNCEN